MKLIDIVEDIHGGTTRKEDRTTLNDKKYVYKKLTIKSVNNKFINKEFLEDFNSLNEIDEKFLTRKNDIILCTKTYNSVYIKDYNDEGFLVGGNFIILRNIKIEPSFLYNYLNLLNFNIKDLKDDANTNITKTDLENLEIPDLPDNSINKISEITETINNRQKAYATLMDNDQELIKLVYEKEGCVWDE